MLPPLRAAERTKTGRLSHEPPRSTWRSQAFSARRCRRTARRHSSDASNPPSTAMHCRAWRKSRTDWMRRNRHLRACDSPTHCRSHCNCVGMAERIAPPARCRRAAARGIFPFRFGRQAIRPGTTRERRPLLFRLFVQPPDIGLGILPIETNSGPTRRFDRGRRGRIGHAVAGRMPAHIGDRIAWLGLVACRLRNFRNSALVTSYLASAKARIET